MEKDHERVFKVLVAPIFEQVKTPIFETIKKNYLKFFKNSPNSIQQFQSLLKKPQVDLKELREVASYGIPDEVMGLRSLVWKILLGYLPSKMSSWRLLLAKHRSNYELYCGDYLSKEKFSHLEDLKNNQKKEESKMTFTKTSDHPLSLQSDSDWNMYFSDQDLWDDIEKDTKRTRLELCFFGQASIYSKNYCVSLSKLSKPDLDSSNNIRQSKGKNGKIDFERIETHQDILTRILFIYAKLNPTIKYAQGMNELLAIIYFVFQDDCIEDNRRFAEADSFFCFTILMEDVKDGFLKNLESIDSGIKKRVKTLNLMLKKYDSVLWSHLETQGIDNNYYSLKWLMLLLTQEFEIIDVLKVWDVLLGHKEKEKVEYLNYICLSILSLLKKELVEADFSGCMERIQKINDLNIFDVIKISKQIFDNKKQIF